MLDIIRNIMFSVYGPRNNVSAVFSQSNFSAAVVCGFGLEHHTLSCCGPSFASSAGVVALKRNIFGLYYDKCIHSKHYIRTSLCFKEAVRLNDNVLLIAHFP